MRTPQLIEAENELDAIIKEAADQFANATVDVEPLKDEDQEEQVN